MDTDRIRLGHPRHRTPACRLVATLCQALLPAALALGLGTAAAQTDSAYFAQLTAYSGALYFIKGDTTPIDEFQFGAGKPCSSGICSRGRVTSSDGGAGVALGITKACCVFGIEQLHGTSSRTGQVTFTGPADEAFLKGAHLDFTGTFAAGLLELGVVANGSAGITVGIDGLTRGSASLTWDGASGTHVGPGQNTNLALVDAKGKWSVFSLGDGVYVKNGATYTVSYGLSVNLALQGTTNADVSADFGHTLAFRSNGPVFDLPPGWTAQSADLSIVGNNFCPPGACVPPVPEPPPGLLWLLGIAALAAARWRPA